MKHREIEARVQDVIGAYRSRGIGPSPETVARAMIDQEEATAVAGRGAASAYEEYHKAATWKLVLLDERNERPDDSSGRALEAA